MAADFSFTASQWGSPLGWVCVRLLTYSYLHIHMHIHIVLPGDILDGWKMILKSLRQVSEGQTPVVPEVWKSLQECVPKTGS